MSCDHTGRGSGCRGANECSVLDSSLLMELTVQMHVCPSQFHEERSMEMLLCPSQRIPTLLSILLEISIANGAVGW